MAVNVAPVVSLHVHMIPGIYNVSVYMCTYDMHILRIYNIHMILRIILLLINTAAGLEKNQ